MKEEFVSLKEDLSNSPLYSEDLAPVPAEKRTWNTWHLAFLWVGMAVCIPTYMLAAFMIKSGMSWYASLIVIGLANLVITLPMVLNGHAGVKYGLPFPVLGRAAFGIHGIHIVEVIRAVVACGWFGIQTWIGGLAIYAIFNAATGGTASAELGIGQFACFGIFWLINMFFVWKGTESIKWLEEYSAPILVLMGIALIVWGTTTTGGFGTVLDNSAQLAKPSAQFEAEPHPHVLITPVKDKSGNNKAQFFSLQFANGSTSQKMEIPAQSAQVAFDGPDLAKHMGEEAELTLMASIDGKELSSKTKFQLAPAPAAGNLIWTYLIAFTAMVGFWATMSLSIADITRYAKSQKAQMRGQFIGLPGTMMLYSFVGIFVTAAAVVSFQDVLASEDAPWDPVSLLARFENPWVVIVAQVFMLIATLSTNIAANVIAPSNAFSNLSPKNISFKMGGLITGVIGILSCPWIMMDKIGGALIFVSGLLGPVLGIMLADYYLVRGKKLSLEDLFKVDGIYAYSAGFNPKAMLALFLGIAVALTGFFIPQMHFLYDLSWFSGFAVAFVAYWLTMKKVA